MARNPYAVKTVVMGSGERLPTLVDLAAGEPLGEPTLYVLTEIRATNRSSSTIDHVLRSIMVLQLYLDSTGIDIEGRFLEGRVLSLNEIDGVVRHCRKSVVRQLAGREMSASAHVIRPGNVNGAQFARVKRATIEVAGHTAANRIRAISRYLDWLVKYRMASLQLTSPARTALWNDWMWCKDALDARVPRHKGRNVVGLREGLSTDVVNRLLSVTAPDSPENPWQGTSARVRNYLVIRWLLELGLRRGELLNIKIPDINFHSEELLVARRADDPEDPRKDQPKVKTRDRKLPVSSSLCAVTHEYIMKIRGLYPHARRHPYLFVATGTGVPLSLSAVNRIFADLHEAFPAEFYAVTPHVLRHTWNDRFSESMDKVKVTESEEEKMRSFLMGWSPTSKTALHYTRRHIRRGAQQVSLQMQAELVREIPDGD